MIRTLALLCYKLTASSSTLFAFSKCDASDWKKHLCELPKAGVRCQTDLASRTMVRAICAYESCPAYIGGCAGFLKKDFWLPVSINSVSMRCQCAPKKE
ncbi:hypothetical protein SAMN06296036_1185 [Pseudobacteriovorax antillogorgiicola]|uniref:Secreted protein n=1 Tax=Pseudobacteriovorax antillogorgiicola TaxID=1513793 RepID=A0A1Y6CC93_9BACT|nr:hypothetical protein EDD56_118136 [Pseudobacteriovorax antillogorgiicola]SMF56232.1 hypothetical protein SAMN06296036_1185 [Pseudobacteriovorax antillogorgiicola]